MTERANNSFWIDIEHKLCTFESSWYKEHVNKTQKPDGEEEQVVIKHQQKDYSMGGQLNNSLEKVIGNHLVLVGPVVDSFLEEIGKGMYAKMTRGKSTGLMPPINLFCPWQIMKNIIGLCTGYGCDVKNINKGKKTDKIVVFIEKSESAEKLFHPRRFNGICYLKKRHFAKKKLLEGNEKPIWVYDGHSLVPVTMMTAIRFDYKYDTQKLMISFYVQRYNADNFPMDTTLQKTMND